MIKHFHTLLRKNYFLLTLFCLVYCPSVTFSQITVDSSPTPIDLVQNVLLGGGISVSNVSFTGCANCRGTFQGNSNVGMTDGILLTTGDITVAIGPNDMTSESSGGGTSGDADLDAIISNTTYDASVLEFDFIPSSDTISFNYVFGSEEYPEYVCSNFNDVFAFFLSGLNPAGGNYVKENIALIPGTTTPVAINSVNSGTVGAFGTPGGCISLAYSSLYVDNTGGTTIEYDGFTTVLKAVAPVVSCTPYHIKIAIADVGDGAYDSGVFLQAKSFSSPSVSLSALASTNDSVMVEGCGIGTYTFSRSGSTALPYTIHYIIGGTATNGLDYEDLFGQPIADSIVFPSGLDTVTLSINPIQDNIPEGDETITISIPQVLSCVDDTITATIHIKNVSPLDVTTSGDTVICSQNGDVATVMATINGGYGPFTFAWSPIAGNTSTISVSPPQTTTYSVLVTDTCGTATASNTITVEVICPVQVPNVFTPNNDQFNDVFFIKNLDMYPNSRLLIYNRWGGLVLENSDYKNDWDGDGHSEGTYYYILYVSDGSTYHGTVTLIK